MEDEDINIGDFVVPTYEYWSAFIGQNENLIQNCFDVWPNELKVIECFGLIYGVWSYEVLFKNKAMLLFRRDIDEIIKKQK